ncbi:MAG TPA: PAS domain S-box protein [Flavobacterium sp.]|nr:PAS domain S-box protein [Flavobacterium sp.]
MGNLSKKLWRLLLGQASEPASSELKFKAIFEQPAVGIIHADAASGKLLEINSRYSKMLGYSIEELLSKSIEDITHPDDLPEIRSRLNKLKAGQARSFTMKKRYISKSGAAIWVNITTSPLWQEGEKPTSHISIIEDITLQKESDEAIKNSESRFKSLFDDFHIVLWEEDFSLVKKHLQHAGLMGLSREEASLFFDQNADFVKECIKLVKIINVNNESLKEHYPKTKEELVTQLDAIIDDTAIASFKAQLIAITQNEQRLAIDSNVSTPEGKNRDISLRWNVMPGYEDTLERVIVSSEDITARKASEKIIVESQKKLESLINTIDGIVWECDETRRFTYINDKAEQITGYKKEEWLGNPNFWEAIIHPDDREWVMDSYSSRSKATSQHDFEYRIIAKDGSIIWIRDIVNIIHEKEEPLALRGIKIDITKSRESEKDLSNSFNLVTEQNKRLLNFSYIVSHNLRSHTSNIQSIASLIETAEDDEERNELVKMLQSVSNTLNETMMNLNEVVNIQTNMNMTLEDLNLKDYITKTLEIVSEQIFLKKAAINFEVAPHVYVKFNAAYLQSILFNFISNALRYSHPGRQPVITLKSYIENTKTVLEISDNGIGIDLKKYGDKLFGMYKTFHDNPDSKGIGLFITKNQIDAMGASLSVESEPNVGTAFKIYFK